MLWDKTDTPLTMEPPRSISDQVFEFLREKILAGEIKPGERLMQNPVAEMLKTSRTPVREAFRRLEQDGLVERVLQGGVKATSVSSDTIHEVFGVRGILEAYAIELACDNVTPGDIALLKELSGRAWELLKSEAVDQETKRITLLDLNSRFHEIIYKATRNRFLMRLINDLRSIVLRMRALGLRASGTWTQAWGEHDRLIELLEEKDKVAASEKMKLHIKNAAEHVVESIRQAEAEKSIERRAGE